MGLALLKSFWKVIPTLLMGWGFWFARMGFPLAGAGLKKETDMKERRKYSSPLIVLVSIDERC
jgi:hypothetical protein